MRQTLRDMETREEKILRVSQLEEVIAQLRQEERSAPYSAAEVRQETAAWMRENGLIQRASLRDALHHGDKSLVGNKGYRKFLQAGRQQFTVDEDKIR